jgi:hypothetical protein
MTNTGHGPTKIIAFEEHYELPDESGIDVQIFSHTPALRGGAREEMPANDARTSSATALHRAV